MLLIQQSDTAHPIKVLVTNSTDHTTGVTGLSSATLLAASKVSKNTGTLAAAAGSFVEAGNGEYNYTPAAAEVNTLGEMTLSIVGVTGSDPVDVVRQVVAFNPYATIGTQVWTEAIPGAYGAGTAGNILGNRLDVAVSTRATSAGAGGAGSRQVTITVNKPDTVTPLGSCAVWVSTDLGGTNVVAGTLYTNDSTGQVTFMLDNGTYYYWRQHPAYTFANPVAITVS